MAKYLWIALAIMTALLIWSHLSKAGAYVELKKLKQNTAALQSSVRYERNRVGELEAVRLAYIESENKLRRINSRLSEELDKERGKVVALVAIDAAMEDSVKEIPTTVAVSDSVFTFEWKHEDDSRSLRGVTKYYSIPDSAITQIISDVFRISLVTGIKERSDGLYEIFVRSNNDHVVLNVEGAIVEPKLVYQKKKHWSVGPFLGAALTGDGRLQPVLGVGVTYSAISF